MECSAAGDLSLTWAITPAAREAGVTSRCTTVISPRRAVQRSRQSQEARAAPFGNRKTETVDILESPKLQF